MRVYNKRSAHPTDAVYVGRPTKWGNPFVIGRHGDRDQVVSQYEQYLLSNEDLMNSLHELKGKSLICWCAPQACHADVLIKYANMV